MSSDRREFLGHAAAVTAALGALYLAGFVVSNTLFWGLCFNHVVHVLSELEVSGILIEHSS